MNNLYMIDNKITETTIDGSKNNYSEIVIDTFNNAVKLRNFLKEDNGVYSVVTNKYESINTLHLSHSIPDTNPANGIPEISGDGNSIASITIQIRTGDTYSIQKNGTGEWDYEEVKISDGQIITDNTYSGLVLGLGITKGSLNKREVVLDSNSQGVFKVKSEAKTCIGNEAAVISITPKDVNDIIGTSMKLEFAPVDF